MEKRLNIGVISCAEMSQRHMQSIVESPDAELYGICDIDPDALNEAKTRFPNVKVATDNYMDLVNDPEIDAIYVITPDQTHKEISIAALKAGKHVLCEKPLALKVDECKEIVRVANASGKKFMVGQICRFTPGFVTAKQLIDRGEIGELFYAETEYAHDYSIYAKPWRLDPLRHGFLGGGCHAVDLIRWIAGDPEEVMAYSNHKMLPGWPTDDCTVAIMKFPNNVIGKVFVSTGCKRNYTMRSVFYGSKGTIICDNTSKCITVFKSDLTEKDSLFQDKPRTYVIPIEYPVPVNNHNTSGELAEFIDCVVNDKPMLMTGEEGAKTVIAALAAVESTKTGMPVRPDYTF